MRSYRLPLIALIVLLLLVPISCQLIPSATSAPTNTPDAAAVATAQTFVEKNKFGYGYTGNDKFAAVAMHQSGEQLFAMTEVKDGKITKVTGAIWSDPDKGTLMVLIGDDGLPEKAFFQDTIVLFSNYTDSTIDIAVISNEGSVQIERGVSIDADKLSKLKQAYQGSGYKLAKLADKSQETEISLSKVLTLASLVVGFIACMHAVALGPIIVLCGSFLLNLATELFPNDPTLSTLNAYMDRYGCVMALATIGKNGASECVQAVIGLAKEKAEDFEENSKKQDKSITEAHAALVAPAKEEDITLKAATPTLAATFTHTPDPQYGCDNPNLTPEEKAHCGVNTYRWDISSTGNDSACVKIEEESTITQIFVSSFDNVGFFTRYHNGERKSGKRISKNTYQFEDYREIHPGGYYGDILISEITIEILNNDEIIKKEKREWIPDHDTNPCRQKILHIYKLFKLGKGELN